jgi:F-type H+-transporting ATPase subunit b
MKITKLLLALAFLMCIGFAPVHLNAYAQVQPAQTSAEKSGEASSQSSQANPEHPSIARELAKETKEAAGEEEEENANLKHSSMVQKIAKLTGLSVHQAHLLAMVVNFAIIAGLIFWFGRKSVPGMMRARDESIRRGLEEARAASQDAARRLADIENRLKQMDAEIGKMQAAAEKDAEGEEGRMQQVTQEEIRKLVQAAEQEIVAAGKQVRRELSAHTADLAIALARKQINVDANTDQVLVRNFSSKLASNSDGGKDGR